MKIPEHIKHFAKEAGLPKVTFIGKLGEFDVYVAFDPKAPYMGPSQYILSNKEVTRWASFDETEQIMSMKE